MNRRTDVLVVGASASGLATAACLRQAGATFEVLEAEAEVGAPWRHHYDRLHLHTPRATSALPGLRMPSSWPRYPRATRWSSTWSATARTIASSRCSAAG